MLKKECLISGAWLVPLWEFKFRQVSEIPFFVRLCRNIWCLPGFLGDILGVFPRNQSKTPMREKISRIGFAEECSINKTQTGSTAATEATQRNPLFLLRLPGLFLLRMQESIYRFATLTA